MLFMVKVLWDIDRGNALSRSGQLGAVVESILDAQKPVATYFPAAEGRRSAILFVELDNASQMPSIGEPWFLALNATVEFQPVMRPQDFAEAGPSIGAAVERFG